VIGEAGLVDELSEQGITALGGPADNGKTFSWEGAQDPVVTLDPEVIQLRCGFHWFTPIANIQLGLSEPCTSDCWAGGADPCYLTLRTFLENQRLV
jgi:hypothetical protein